MRATVYVTDESGKRYEGSVELSPVSNAVVTGDETKDDVEEGAQISIDFTLPIRAFVRTYAAVDQTAPQNAVYSWLFWPREMIQRPSPQNRFNRNGAG